MEFSDRFGRMSDTEHQSDAKSDASSRASTPRRERSKGPTPNRDLSIIDGQLQGNLDELDIIAGQINRQVVFATWKDFADLDMFTAQVRFESLESYAAEYYALFMDTIAKVLPKNKKALQDRYNQIDDLRMSTAGIFRRLIRDEELRYERREIEEGNVKTDPKQPSTVNVIMPPQATVFPLDYDLFLDT